MTHLAAQVSWALVSPLDLGLKQSSTQGLETGPAGRLPAGQSSVTEPGEAP